jgi:hypothetical protein
MRYRRLGEDHHERRTGFLFAISLAMMARKNDLVIVTV